MTRMARAGCWLLWVVLCVFPLRSVSAQTNERLYENLDFRFDTPGARALGLGDAFVGLADDASAALSNPAGLSNLLVQEFSFEFTRTNMRRTVTPAAGATASQTFGQVVFTPSFMSYALPVKRATLLLYRNTQQRFREAFEFGPRAVATREAPEDGAFGSISVDTEDLGVGAAYVVHPRVSVGASVNLVALDLASEARSGTRLNPRNGTNTIASGYEWTFTAGTLVKLRRGLAVGAAYAKGATFALETRLFGQFLWTEFDPEGRVVLTGEARPIDYVIPSRYAVGASWKVLNRITIAADLNRVAYSQRVTDRFLVVDFVDPAARLMPSNFYVRDVTEFHGGAEYRIYLRRSAVAVRAGMFTDPSHPLRFRSGGNNLAHPANTLLDFRFNTVPDSTVVGATVGTGVAIADRVQIDVAVSRSQRRNQFIASLVVRPD